MPLNAERSIMAYLKKHKKPRSRITFVTNKDFFVCFFRALDSRYENSQHTKVSPTSISTNDGPLHAQNTSENNKSTMFFAVRQGIVVCKSRHAGKKKKTKNRLENTILCKRENAPFRRVVSAVHFKPKLLYHKCFLKKIGNFTIFLPIFYVLFSITERIFIRELHK